MTDQAEFYDTIASYLKKDIIVPIYSSDNLAVLRIADTFYVATDYTKGKKGYISFLVNSKMIRAMMVDESYLQQLMLTGDRQTLATMMFEMDRDTFHRFRNYRAMQVKGEFRNSFVDEEMEKWIFETYGKPEIKFSESRRKGIASLFKK